MKGRDKGRKNRDKGQGIRDKPKDNGKGSSRFSSGMTARKARAKQKQILRFAQDDNFLIC
jgi:hypothetical protein